jgi:hypothetical protein
MIDFVVSHQALIREMINGSAMILFLTLTMMVSVFMWDTMVEYTKSRYFVGTPRDPSRSWTHAPGIPTACALWWVFIAETYRTGAVWSLYQIGKGQRDGGIFFDGGSYWTSYGYLLAGIALNAGLLRAIYIFTPPEWKSKVWIHAAIGAVVFVLCPALFSTIKDLFHGF